MLENILKVVLSGEHRIVNPNIVVDIRSSEFYLPIFDNDFGFTGRVTLTLLDRIMFMGWQKGFELLMDTKVISERQRTLFVNSQVNLTTSVNIGEITAFFRDHNLSTKQQEDYIFTSPDSITTACYLAALYKTRDPYLSFVKKIVKIERDNLSSKSKGEIRGNSFALFFAVQIASPVIVKYLVDHRFFIRGKSWSFKPYTRLRSKEKKIGIQRND